MKWYLAVLKKYAVFSGRARRKEYWMFYLFNMLITLLILFSVALIVVGFEFEHGEKFVSYIGNIYALVTFIPGLAVGVRRMHDTGRSGWWILFPILNFVFLLLDSHPGSNRYGDNPKEDLKEDLL